MLIADVSNEGLPILVTHVYKKKKTYLKTFGSPSQKQP